MQAAISAARPIRLNLACGDAKIPGYTNVDLELTNNPDLVFDITTVPMPFEEGEVEEIVLFHAIEHIQEAKHEALLDEFHRVLKFGGELYISYPEFRKVAENWLTNHKGMKEFWKHTIYGLQRYPGDYHISLMDTPQFIDKLSAAGFVDIEYFPEPNEPYNTVVRAKKGESRETYENLIARATSIRAVS